MKRQLLNLTAFLMAAVLLLPLAGCSKGASIEDLCEPMTECKESIQAQTVYLSNVSKFMCNYWDTMNTLGGDIEYDDMLDKGYDWLSKNSDGTKEGIREAYNTICEQYKNIVALGADGTEAEKAFEEFDALFNAYNGLYLEVTGVDGDIDSFIASHNKYVNEIEQRRSVLDILLSE